MFVGTVEYDFRDFIFRSRLRSGEVRGVFVEGECLDSASVALPMALYKYVYDYEVELLIRERRSFDILFVKKEARLFVARGAAPNMLACVP